MPLLKQLKIRHILVKNRVFEASGAIQYASESKTAFPILGRNGAVKAELGFTDNKVQAGTSKLIYNKHNYRLCIAPYAEAGNGAQANQQLIV